MLLNYQDRFYPTTNQKLELNTWLRVCRYWYNKQLGDRFDWWEHNRTNINACPLVCSFRPQSCVTNQIFMLKKNSYQSSNKIW
uniref:helix-turn-helix domain-containing protein n=1 Tax=Microseira wollei TaxID=467598 RepID=UPI001CFDAFB1|nr:helix-turn-helix domain-containing protein [Microseira wollei]